VWGLGPSNGPLAWGDAEERMRSAPWLGRLSGVAGMPVATPFETLWQPLDIGLALAFILGLRAEALRTMGSIDQSGGAGTWRRFQDDREQS
jgi:hypothetical protein